MIIDCDLGELLVVRYYLVGVYFYYLFVQSICLWKLSICEPPICEASLDNITVANSAVTSSEKRFLCVFRTVDNLYPVLMYEMRPRVP